MQIVWMRYLVHLIIVFMLWCWHRPGRIWRTKRPAYHLVRSPLMMLIMPLSMGLSLISGVPISFAWVVFWLSPALAIVLAVIWLHERPPYWTWEAAILGFLGVGAILLPTILTSPRALVMPFVMALSFGLYVVMTRSLRSETVEARLFYTALGVFAVLTLFVPRGWITPSLHDIEMILGVGATGFVALWLIDWSLSHAPVSAASPALYLQVAYVSIIEMLFECPARDGACARRHCWPSWPEC